VSHRLVLNSFKTDVTRSAAEGALKAREDFFKLISHELRTPLNGVMGMLSLLKLTDISPEQQAYIDTAQESGDHLLSLVNNLLDYARLDAGHFDLEPTQLNPEPLLQGIAELLSPRAFQNDIDIIWGLDPNLKYIIGDEGRLRQILFNLAGNAVKFTRKGGVLIDISLIDSGLIRLKVTDTGPGIPLEAHTRIFEAFGQAEKSHATVQGGAGLGLMVVKKLVDAMRGHVYLESKVGYGSSFYVDLPLDYSLNQTEVKSINKPVYIISNNEFLASGAHSHLKYYGYSLIRLTHAKGLKRNSVLLADRRSFDDISPAPTAHSLILLAPEQRNEISAWIAVGWSGYLIKPLRRHSLMARLEAMESRDKKSYGPNIEPDAEDERVVTIASTEAEVLLVEDNPVNALLAQILLQREGCHVLRATSGEEAIDIVCERRLDLVFMDLGLPGLNGLDTTRALREKGCRLPIIALTANAYEEDRRDCLAAGMDDFLTKPIEVETLRFKLATWIGRKSLDRV
jgi:CheY-like chemotaxis protein